MINLRVILYFMVFLLFNSCRTKVERENTYMRNDTLFNKFTNDPVTGEVVEYYNNRKVSSNIEYKDGIMLGEYEYYDPKTFSKFHSGYREVIPQYLAIRGVSEKKSYIDIWQEVPERKNITLEIQLEENMDSLALLSLRNELKNIVFNRYQDFYLDTIIFR